MKLLTILIFSFLTFSGFAQMKNFRKVNFEFQRSRRVRIAHTHGAVKGITTINYPQKIELQQIQSDL